MYSSRTHGGTDVLVKLNEADGTRIDYDDNFKSVSLCGQKYFKNVVIDKEKVYLHYDIDYVIDLKTDTIEVIKN